MQGKYKTVPDQEVTGRLEWWVQTFHNRLAAFSEERTERLR